MRAKPDCLRQRFRDLLFHSRARRETPPIWRDSLPPKESSTSNGMIRLYITGPVMKFRSVTIQPSTPNFMCRAPSHRQALERKYHQGKTCRVRGFDPRDPSVTSPTLAFIWTFHRNGNTQRSEGLKEESFACLKITDTKSNMIKHDELLDSVGDSRALGAVGSIMHRRIFFQESPRVLANMPNGREPGLTGSQK